MANVVLRNKAPAFVGRKGKGGKRENYEGWILSPLSIPVTNPIRVSPSWES